VLISHTVMFPPEIFSFLASEARVLVACSQASHLCPTRRTNPLCSCCRPQVYDADVEYEHHLIFMPHQLSTPLSDNPQILNYLRSLCLCVEVPRLHSDEVKKDIIAILGRLKLECVRLQVTHDFEYWHRLPLPFVPHSLLALAHPS